MLLDFVLSGTEVVRASHPFASSKVFVLSRFTIAARTSLTKRVKNLLDFATWLGKIPIVEPQSAQGKVF